MGCDDLWQKLSWPSSIAFTTGTASCGTSFAALATRRNCCAACRERRSSWKQYQALVEKTGGGTLGIDIGASRSKAGTFNALIANYFKSDAFTKALAKATQDMRRPILNRFRETQAPSGQTYGDKRVAAMRGQDVAKLLHGKSRHAQSNWLKSFRGLMAFAISEAWRADDPSAGITPVKGPKSMGHMTWLEPQVEQYRQRHKLGTKPRLALELLLNIAARRYDAHVIGAQHVIISNADGKKKLCWRPHKTLRSTGKMLKVTIIPSLQAALDAMPKSGEALAFLTNDYGRPFASAAAFGNKFADWCRRRACSRCFARMAASETSAPMVSGKRR